MAGIADERFPRRRLAHRLTEVSCFDGNVGFYALHAIDIPRPRTGRTVASIRCRTCGELVQCTVYSVKSVRGLRRQWFLLGCTLIPASIIGIGVLIGALDGSGSTDPLADCAIWLAFLITGVCILVAFRRSWSDDGLRIKARRLRHSLREPGDISDPSDPSDPSFPLWPVI